MLFRSVDVFQRQFGFVVTVSVQMVVGNAQLLADEFGDSLEGGRLGNFDVASHDATLVLYKKAKFTTALCERECVLTCIKTHPA